MLDRAHAILSEEVMPAAPDDHPLWPGQASGTTTDDTAQSFLLARRLLIDGPVVDSSAWTRDLAAWVASEDAAGRGAHIGPSTRDAVLHPAADGTGRPGTTNGSTMRVVPLGIALAGRPALIAEAAVAAGRPAHDSDVAHAASAAVAAAVAAGVAGGDMKSALDAAAAAANEAGKQGLRTGRSFAAKLSQALTIAVPAADAPDAARLRAIHEIATRTGTGVEADQSVVVAFGIATLERRDAWRAARMGASLGGDADTMAGIAAAIVGATTGTLAPPTVLDYIDRRLIDEAVDVSEMLLRVT